MVIGILLDEWKTGIYEESVVKLLKNEILDLAIILYYIFKFCTFYSGDSLTENAFLILGPLCLSTSLALIKESPLELIPNTKP